MKYIRLYIEEFVSLSVEMAPWLLFGFLIAGILHVFFPDGKINRFLGKTSLKSVFRAALIGIPLPLCSCGVIPTGVSLHKNGASKGAAISFLISTPQTGVDSIMVTYSLLGLPFAIIRPIVALITGVFGGLITNKSAKGKNQQTEEGERNQVSGKPQNPLLEIFRYAFVDFLADIAKWLLIGLLIAALMSVIIPDDFFASYVENSLLGMLLVLIASIPVYVCATSSVPIAAVLIMKGLSPGAALVFLMAGPATNAATISVIGNSLGKKTLFVYLATLIVGSLVFGAGIDYLLPREWFTLVLGDPIHEHSMLPKWLEVFSAITLGLLILNILIQNIIRKTVKTKPGNIMDAEQGTKKIIVKGMNCNHCKMSVETNLQKISGVEGVQANLSTEEVIIKGLHVDLEKVKTTVEGLGFKYGS